MGKKHPDFYSCLIEFQKERDTETCMAELGLGKSVKAAPKREWIAIQERLRRIAEEYEDYKSEGRIIEYLEAMSYNVVVS